MENQDMEDIQKKNIVLGKKEIEITNQILEITNKEIKDIKKI